MRRTRVLLPVVLLLGTLAACAQPAAPSSEASAEATPMAFPAAAGAPPSLPPGTYATPAGPTPRIWVTVPDGWYGAGGSSAFGIGRGLDIANARFADAGLYVNVIDKPYAEAVSVFEALPGLEQRAEPTTAMVGGHNATVFEARANTDHVLLDRLAPGLDIGTTAGKQIFVDVNGATVLIRTEVNSASAQAALDAVVASLRFS